MPSYWISFFTIFIKAALYNTKAVIRTDPINIDLWMDVVERRQVTRIVIVPVIGQILLKSKNLRPLPSIKSVIVGGERFSENFLNDLTPIFPNAIIQCLYGSTEHVLLTISREDGPFGASSGYPFYNSQIKIVDESGSALGPNEEGEICYKSFVPFSGYYGDPEATKLAFDSEGFIKSGDIGYFDDNGRLYVLYRIKHMMRVPAPGYGALVVIPIEIENVINEIDGVLMSAVVGVHDDSIGLDMIYAFVIKDSSKEELNEEFIINYVKERVIEARRITGGVQFIDKFPMTPSNKILYRKLQEIAKEIHAQKCLTKMA